MDVAWFKAQQKRVGVTAQEIADRMGRTRANVSHILTGRQRMSLEWATAFSDVLQVPLAMVLEKAGLTDAPRAAAIALRDDQSDVIPLRVDDISKRKINGIAAAIMADKPGIDIWQIRSRAMVLAGFMPGDFVLLDAHNSERARPGDLVVAQIYQRNGTAATVLRRLEPPVLVAASNEPDFARVYVVDGDNVAIRGTVIASWRI